MTIGEKKAYLSQYKTLDRRINQLTEDLARWRARAEAISPVYSAMPLSGGNGDKVAVAIEHIITLEQEINAEIDRLVNLRRTIEMHIETIPEDKLRDLMRYRYIDGLTLEQTADKMSVSYQWAWVLHGRALQKIQIT